LKPSIQALNDKKKKLSKTIVLLSRFSLCVQSTIILGFYYFIANNNLDSFSNDSSYEPSRCSSTFLFCNSFFVIRHFILVMEFYFILYACNHHWKIFHHKSWYSTNNKICSELMVIFLDKSRATCIWSY